jgi:hypothetical protein
MNAQSNTEIINNKMSCSNLTRMVVAVTLLSLISEECFTPRQDGDISINTYYRVPEHQRFPAWSLAKKQRLVDSVLRNFPIHAIIGVEQKKIQGNSIIEWCDIEDGQTRMTYLQDFMMDKFPCEKGYDCVGNGCYFSELSSSLQQTFKNYQVTLEKFKGDNISSDHISEIFTRLNSGKPLGDNDKFHSRKETAVLIYLEELKTHHELRSDFTKFIGPIGTTKKFVLLGDIIGAMLAIATRNDETGGQACINTSYELNHKYLRNAFTIEQKNDIIAFFKAYFEMLHQANDDIDAKPKKSMYCKLSGVLGLSVCSWVRFGQIQEAIGWYIGKMIEYPKYSPATFDQLNKGDIRNCQGPSVWRRLEKIMEQYDIDNNGVVASGLGVNFEIDTEDEDFDEEDSNDSERE